MYALRLNQDIRPVSEFRANDAAFVQQVRTRGRPMVITQHGRGAAVLLDIGEVERRIDRIEMREEIAAAEQPVERGEGLEHDDALRLVMERVRR
jgi:prevent-host-death family protein